LASYASLIIWWAGTITAGTLFLIITSMILYYFRKTRESTIPLSKLLKSFTFVWVLLSLLILYIISIEGGNYTLFAAGNIVTEIFIFGYLIATRKRVLT
jgi:hypothetical protein